ncbi:hypothetical protein EBM17_07940 [Shigella boydii]|uniref:Uncharacterized protein n=1 Tax=Shigella dysenteriae TaxID=622 RepID=A0A2S8DD13_SHIDY|nr:hypothetical protein [Shigella boydii]EFW0126491.1 hypothetical protein [Shigella dysenteriae]EFW7713650.1 hypothetical protein [Shigella boydii]EFW7730512.1 hypothetical protein [Shigella boydii]EFW8152280.1 hypothetical protein [Shigella dysenteriae]
MGATLRLCFKQTINRHQYLHIFRVLYSLFDMHRRIFSAISHKDYRQCLTKRMAFTYNAHAEKSAFYYGSGIIATKL